MAKAKSNKTVIDLSLGQRREFEIDGHDFTVDFDDAHKLRAFLEARDEAARILGADEADKIDEGRLTELYGEVSEVLIRAIDILLGEGATATIFGDERPVFRAMALVGALANEVGPAYDEIIEAYRRSH